MGARHMTATEVNERNREWRERPLTPEQARLMAEMQAVILAPLLERLEAILAARGIDVPSA